MAWRAHLEAWRKSPWRSKDYSSTFGAWRRARRFPSWQVPCGCVCRHRCPNNYCRLRLACSRNKQQSTVDWPQLVEKIQQLSSVLLVGLATRSGVFVVEPHHALSPHHRAPFGALTAQMWFVLYTVFYTKLYTRLDKTMRGMKRHTVFAIVC